MKNIYVKTNILCICVKGLNRSKYLAEYLRGKGYATRYGGMEKDEDPNTIQRLVTQEDIDWADTLIVVKPRLKDVLLEKFKIRRKKIIVLDVTDSKRIVVKDHPHLESLSYMDFQKKWTRPQLRNAINKHLN